MSLYESEIRWRTIDSTVWKESLAEVWQARNSDSYHRYATDGETLLTITQVLLVWQIYLSLDGPTGETFNYSQLPSYDGSTKYRYLSELDRAILLRYDVTWLHGTGR